RRPGDEDDAVRIVDDFLEALVGVDQHADALEVEGHAALVEQTHDDAFAVDHRNDGHADVDLAIVDAHLDAAVLRQTFFRDVEPRHDLESADDGRLKAAQRFVRRLRLEQTVDAVADTHRTLFRLDVNVAGAFVDCFDEDFVHELDDAGLLGHLRRLAVVRFQPFEQLDLFLVAFLHQGGNSLAADAEVRLDEAGNFARTGEDGMDMQSR